MSIKQSKHIDPPLLGSTPRLGKEELTYPGSLIVEVAAFVFNAVWMPQKMKEFHFFTNVFPFLIDTKPYHHIIIVLLTFKSLINKLKET